MDPIIDINEYELLVDLDEEIFSQTYKDVTQRMRKNQDWYYLTGLYKGSLTDNFKNTQFTEVISEKHLGLGRSTFYDSFLQQMSEYFGHRVHQSDYMVWVEPSNPYTSLNFYIDTAEKIEICLEGISGPDLRQASQIGKRVQDRRELDSRYMTLWEINQLLFSDAKHKTTWHLRGGISVTDVCH